MMVLVVVVDKNMIKDEKVDDLNEDVIVSLSVFFVMLLGFDNMFKVIDVLLIVLLIEKLMFFIKLIFE